MHSHHHHREHQVGHRRVNHILKGEPAGAKHHSKSPAFSKVTSKRAAERHDDVHGHKVPKRYARGGRTKGHKGQQTNIAIVMPHKGQGAPGGLPMPPGAAGLPGGAPPLPGGPPGMPPGMPPGGPPMRARGGRTKEPHIDGEATAGNLKGWAKRAGSNSYARGGKAMTAGAATGVGRLEEAALVRRKKVK
jgi:hypothetical protein